MNEYSDNFIHFIENADLLFPKTTQENYFRKGLVSYYKDIKKNINEGVKLYTQKVKITQPEIRKIVDSVVNERRKQLENFDKLTNFSAEDVLNLVTKYSTTIEEAKSIVFVNLPISISANTNLKKIAGLLFSRKIFPKNVWGVVIAGFGDDEMFPHVVSFEIECIINRKAKFKKAEEHKTNESTTACIIPFAQADMVATFMEGVELGYQNYLLGGLPSLLTKKYPNYIVQEIGDLSNTKRKAFALKLQKVGQGVFDEFK